MLDVKVVAPSSVSHYVLSNVLGQGAFSLVCLAHDTVTRKSVACKIVPRERLSDVDLQRRFENEMYIFQQLDHPGIVKLLDFESDDRNYYVFMEFCGGGELFEFITEQHKLSEDQARPLVRQILSALKYLHSLGICHRDLKPENLMLDCDGTIKLSDFGLSRYVSKQDLCATPCGSPCYAAPEVISGQLYDGTRADVWSLGVIVYAMVTGQLPWTKHNYTQLFHQIQQGQYRVPESLSPECQEMIKGMMTVDPESRWTIDELLTCSWLGPCDVKIDSENPLARHAAAVSLRKVEAGFDCSVFREWRDLSRGYSTASLSGRPNKIGKLSRLLRKAAQTMPHQLQEGSTEELPSPIRPRVRHVVLRPVAKYGSTGPQPLLQQLRRGSCLGRAPRLLSRK